MRSAPETPPLEFKTREQAAYESIRQAIIQGRWGPDEPVVVSRIAAGLGVSRITIANALKRLAGEGFVRLTPHKEAVVARLDPDGVREIYLMRAELEALATREAASRISADDFDQARRLNETVRQRRAELPAAIHALRAADRAFHRHVRSTAGMPRLDQVLENLADQCEYYRSRLLDPSRLSAPDPAAHAALLELLARHDTDAAGRLMRDHVLGGMRTVLSTLGRQA
ncbi:MAG TPA: GntR family transcriptional regulator [bacterium]|nr:GntR family transcriptional regulator [bacterium]